MAWKYVPKAPQWKGWEIERQQKNLKDFLEEEDEKEEDDENEN